MCDLKTLNTFAVVQMCSLIIALLVGRQILIIIRFSSARVDITTQNKNIIPFDNPILPTVVSLFEILLRFCTPFITKFLI